MSTTSINVTRLGVESATDDKAVLTVRPDMRIVKLGFLAAALIAGAGVVVYLSPLDDSVKAGFLPLAVLFIVTLAYSAIVYEALRNAVFTVTTEYVQEQGGVLFKTQHRLPLAYVRDVSYDQSFLQAMFGVSSITVSPTNGGKIVLSNVRDGEQKRETIWNLVLSNSPSKSASKPETK